MLRLPARGAPAAWLAAIVLAQTLSSAPVLAETADSLLANRAQRPPIEWDTDRPGLDYKSFDLSTPSVDSCQISCLNDPKCVAWTYVNPGVQGPKARCWLKSGIPAPQANKCCSSGIKKGQPIRKLGTKPTETGVIAKPDLGKIGKYRN